MGYAKYQNMLGADSSSSGTSPWFFVGDCRLITVSRVTSTASASNLTISLSNDDGLQSSIANFSLATVLPNAGIFTIDPGARWIRAERAAIGISASSNETVQLNRYYQ